MATDAPHKAKITSPAEWRAPSSHHRELAAVGVVTLQRQLGHAQSAVIGVWRFFDQLKLAAAAPLAGGPVFARRQPGRHGMQFFPYTHGRYSHTNVPTPGIVAQDSADFMA